MINDAWLEATATKVEVVCGDFIKIFDEMDTEKEKKEGFIAVFTHIIDKTDTPGIPDWISDPLMKAALPSLFEFFNRLGR